MEKKVHLGELLINAREKKSLSIEDVARITKIRIEFLRALESESYAELPERTYSLGYFRSYAKFLEINDVESLVKILDESYSFNSPEYLQSKGQVFLDEEYSLVNTFKKKMSKEEAKEVSKSSREKTKEKKQKKQKVEHLEEGGFSSSNKLIIVLCVFLAIFLFLGYKLLNDKNSAEENDIVAEAMSIESTTGDDKNLDAVITNDFVVVENKPENSAGNNSAENSEAQNSEIEIVEEFQGSQGDAPTALEVQEEAKEADIANTPKFDTEYTAWPKATRNYQISMSFADDVWVQIYKQDNPNIVYLDRLFKAGDLYDVPKVDNIAMKVGNYKGIKILVDSKELVLTSRKRLSVVLADVILERKSLLDTYPVVSRE